HTAPVRRHWPAWQFFRFPESACVRRLRPLLDGELVLLVTYTEVLSTLRRVPNHRAIRARQAIQVRENQVPFCLEEKAMNDCEWCAGVCLQKKRPGVFASGRQKATELRERREIWLARFCSP